MKSVSIPILFKLNFAILPLTIFFLIHLVRVSWYCLFTISLSSLSSDFSHCSATTLLTLSLRYVLIALKVSEPPPSCSRSPPPCKNESSKSKSSCNSLLSPSSVEASCFVSTGSGVTGSSSELTVSDSFDVGVSGSEGVGVTGSDSSDLGVSGSEGVGVTGSDT